MQRHDVAVSVANAHYKSPVSSRDGDAFNEPIDLTAVAANTALLYLYHTSYYTLGRSDLAETL